MRSPSHRFGIYISAELALDEIGAKAFLESRDRFDGSQDGVVSMSWEEYYWAIIDSEMETFLVH